MLTMKLLKYASIFTAVVLPGVLISYKIKQRNDRLRRLANRRRLKEAMEEKKWNDLWNTALFFPDYFPEKEGSQTKQLIWYLEQAKSTLDICVCIISHNMMLDALQRIAILKEDTIKIRIFTNSRIKCYRRFQQSGIECRNKLCTRVKENYGNSAEMMHHKFVVIDDFAAITGSLNWTYTAISENTENVVITTQPAVVKPLKKEFEHLWNFECLEGKYVQGRRSSNESSKQLATEI